MPNYYNPYNFYPASYMNAMYGGMAPQMQPQQSFAPAQMNQGPKMMEWVEGEVGAKAYQMPNGWPANSPIPLWDSTDTIIWLKSWGPMGIPNPMQKLHYEMPEQQNQALLMNGGNSSGANNGVSGTVAPDMSQYVTKQDFEDLKKDMRNMLHSASGYTNSSGNGNNQNGNSPSGQNGNRGGNK